ncbi:unnamed protein product [Schistosoma haematobium]|nr:unnamed protein product [Schistosoma haematobium]CAH8624923.1 unnamed protein product [Schistosoma haematobium]
MIPLSFNSLFNQDFASRILEHGPNPKNGKSSDKAHPPIHPLKVGDSLQGDEARLYELVTRHFLACLSTDAEGAETIVRLCIGKPTLPRTFNSSISTANLLTSEDGELFESKGLMILALNYLEVYIYDRWAEKDMPVFQLGEWILPDNIQILTGQTCPPPLLTEADLISLMDRHGIGTDATHAEHIETIKQRLYVGLEQNKFLVPGQLGMGLVEGYDSMGFEMSKPNLRSEFEADLKLICEGRKTKEEVLHHHLNKYKELFRLALNQASFLDRALALRLEQEAENVQNISGSVGEMASFAAVNNATDGHNQSNVLNPVVAFCPTCHSGLVLRQKRSALRPLTTSSNISNNPGSNEVNQTSNGGWFLSCSGYPNCRYAIWFPDSVIHVRVLSESNENTCNRCTNFIPSSSVRSSNDQLRPSKLGLRFRRNFYLPNGYFQDVDTKEYITCIFCDEDICRTLGIHIRLVNNSSISSQTTVSNEFSANRDPLTSQTRNSSSPLPFSSTTIGSHHNSYSLLHAKPYLNLHPTCNNSSHSTLPRPPNFSRSVDDAEADDSDNILCNCGHSAIQLTVKKPGPNQGRLFYRCSGVAGNSCDFFLWKSQTSSITIAQSSPLYSSTFVPLRNIIDPCSRLENVSENANCVSSRTSGLGSSDSNSPCVICRCGEPAKLLVVNKQSSNKGRHFYACPNSRPSIDGGPASGCNFFQWADHIDTASGQSDSSVCGLSSRRYASGSSTEQGPSYHRTAVSAETNISVGHVPSWPPPASNNSRGAISRNKNRDFKDRSLSASSTVTRCCGLCRQPGHTRNRCPHSTT